MSLAGNSARWNVPPGDALLSATAAIAAAVSGQDNVVVALKTAVQLLFELARPDPGAHRPLFTEFGSQLLVSHPAEVRRAHAPLLDLLTELTTAAAEAGQLRAGTEPRRAAAVTMETVMFVAQSSGAPPPSIDEAGGSGGSRPITADEIWEFCAHGVIGG